jgi:hypothetical protein
MRELRKAIARLVRSYNSIGRQARTIGSLLPSCSSVQLPILGLLEIHEVKGVLALCAQLDTLISLLHPSSPSCFTPDKNRS